MRNRARNCLKLFSDSNLFRIIPKKVKNYIFLVILRLTHNLSVLENLNVASLFMEFQDLPTVRLLWFLDQFTSTFSDRNHSVFSTLN